MECKNSNKQTSKNVCLDEKFIKIKTDIPRQKKILIAWNIFKYYSEFIIDY